MSGQEECQYLAGFTYLRSGTAQWFSMLALSSAAIATGFERRVLGDSKKKTRGGTALNYNDNIKSDEIASNFGVAVIWYI